MATRSIELTDALERMIAEEIDSGRFPNAAEVVRAGLRALKTEQAAHAAKVEALKAAIQEAEDDLAAGRYFEADDFDTFMDELSAEVDAEFEGKQHTARTAAE